MPPLWSPYWGLISATFYLVPSPHQAWILIYLFLYSQVCTTLNIKTRIGKEASIETHYLQRKPILIIILNNQTSVKIFHKVVVTVG
jgi:hypothetical protein